MNPPTTSQTDPGLRLELWLIVATLVIATFCRFHAPDAVPPGPSHDELRMMDLGEMIVEGERPIHWKVSYSAEPLFMYVLALAMPVWGFTPFGARLVTRFAGLLLIPVVHRLTRRLFGRCAALFTSGVLALTWWPLFFSRVALRGITLPLIFTTAVICLWRGLDLGEHITRGAEMTISWGWLAGGGALMGLTWYTFTAARGLAILLPMLLVYLGLVGAVPLRLLARIALLTLGVASVVAAPFVFEVQTQPGVPETRLDQLGGVIDQFLAGNLLPLVKQSVKTVGLFTVTGDPSWRYNVAGRPVFGPVLGVLAMLGVLLSIARWRQPRYFVMIMWLLLGLAPSMLTPGAPSLVRGIGAVPAAVIFPAIGAATVQQWVSATVGRKTNWAAALAMTLLLAVNGVGTFRSLFVTWPAQSQVREIYQAALTKAFRDLNHSNLGGTLWISEPFPDDRHLLLARRVLRREAIEPRWFNANRALILPAANGSRRYLLADFVEPDQELFRRWVSDAIVILEARVSTSTMPAYRTYQARGGPWVERELSEIMNQSTASRDLGAAHPVALPARFEGTATLLGYELADDRLAAGEEVHLAVYWRVHGPVFEPLVSFAHLLDGQNRIIGQYDGFDVPPWHWEPGAVVAQVYRFSVDRDAQPGTHWVEVGLYNSETMERLAVVDEADSPLAPRLVLGTVIVE